jgi:ABC-type sugar transport system ATPase subunit
MPDIRIEHLAMWYDKVPALSDVSIEVKDGEFFVLLGPSGCGKTTLLRCLAGLETPSGGDVYFGDRCMHSELTGIDVSPKDRHTGFVFQSYALYPHMTVFENVAFGLKIRGVGKLETAQRVDAALDLVDMKSFKGQRPSHLSGGQQQRVALARTIVAQPDILLFDEPLSNLDPLLRVSVRAQLKQLHDRLGTTSIFVTHDQTEAMTLADRIGVLAHGELQQIGSAEEIYDYPATVQVAEFTGNPRTNLLRGEIHVADDRVLFIPDDDPYCFLLVPPECGVFNHDKCIIHVRPEAVSMLPEGGRDEGLLTVIAVMSEGPHTMVALSLDGRTEPLYARVQNNRAETMQRGQRTGIRFLRGNLYTPDTGVLRSSFGYANSM